MVLVGVAQHLQYSTSARRSVVWLCSSTALASSCPVSCKTRCDSNSTSSLF
jgi:hypothetical protein